MKFVPLLAVLFLTPSIAGAQTSSTCIDAQSQPLIVDTIHVVGSEIFHWRPALVPPANAAFVQYLVTYWPDPARTYPAGHPQQGKVLGIDQESTGLIPLANPLLEPFDLDPIVGRCFSVTFRFVDATGFGVPVPGYTDPVTNFSLNSIGGTEFFTAEGDGTFDGFVGVPDSQATGVNWGGNYYTGERASVWVNP